MELTQTVLTEHQLYFFSFRHTKKNSAGGHRGGTQADTILQTVYFASAPEELLRRPSRLSLPLLPTVMEILQQTFT